MISGQIGFVLLIWIEPPDTKEQDFVLAFLAMQLRSIEILEPFLLQEHIDLS